MYENLTPSGSHAVIYRKDGMVCTESLDAPYLSVLEQIRDGIDITVAGLTDDEINDFLDYSLQEGILEKY